MKVKKWLENNSQALQAIAAIIAICGVLVAIPLLWTKAFKADLVLQVDFTESTLPPGLLDWSDNVRRLLPEGESRPSEKSRVSDVIQQLRSSPVAERLKAWRFYDDGIDKISLSIRNQTDHTLTGVRIRVSNMDRLWSTDVRGTYLTSDEAAAFEKKIVLKR